MPVGPGVVVKRQDIGGFHVAMQEPCVMHGSKTKADLLKHLRTDGVDVATEITPLPQIRETAASLRHDIPMPARVVDAVVHYGHDVGMGKSRQCLDLALEPVVAVGERQWSLEGYSLAATGGRGPVNDRHATATEHVRDLVVQVLHRVTLIP